MANISTHVLDTVAGRPAAGVAVTLERVEDGAVIEHLASTSTDEDGRVADLLGGTRLRTGVYRLTFNTAAYGNTFYPEVQIVFRVSDPDEHHHIPLLLSAYGYSTYRGS
ncbi:MAG TPA: hydroxyisourate hydrolase [Acidimicrobiia bacterium]|nr:hydroxyisourate hydrolase [Acidimicrobiia bacterium]